MSTARALWHRLRPTPLQTQASRVLDDIKDDLRHDLASHAPADPLLRHLRMSNALNHLWGVMRNPDLNANTRALNLNTSALVIVQDTAYMNMLSRRIIYFENRRATSVITNVNSPALTARNKLYAGPVIGRSINNFAIGGSVLFVTKKDHGYSYTYDLVNKDHYLGMYWKIHVGKRN
jgi:hypothetical protein